MEFLGNANPFFWVNIGSFRHSVADDFGTFMSHQKSASDSKNLWDWTLSFGQRHHAKRWFIAIPLHPFSGRDQNRTHLKRTGNMAVSMARWASYKPPAYGSLCHSPHRHTLRTDRTIYGLITPLAVCRNHSGSSCEDAGSVWEALFNKWPSIDRGHVVSWRHLVLSGSPREYERTRYMQSFGKTSCR